MPVEGRRRHIRRARLIIEFRSVLTQECDRIDVAGLDGVHETRFVRVRTLINHACHRFLILVRVFDEQIFDELVIATRACVHERRETIAIERIDRCATRVEKSNDGQTFGELVDHRSARWTDAASVVLTQQTATDEMH